MSGRPVKIDWFQDAVSHHFNDALDYFSIQCDPGGSLDEGQPHTGRGESYGRSYFSKLIYNKPPVGRSEKRSK